MSSSIAFVSFVCCLSFLTPAHAARPAPPEVWATQATAIDPHRYFGATLANGMIGILSSAQPLRTAQTLVNGAWDTLWPGAPSSTVESFDFLNLALTIDGVSIERFEQLTDFRQDMNFKAASLTSTFDYQDKATVTYTLRALRHLPYTALLDIQITPRQRIAISATGKLTPPTPLKHVVFQEGGPTLREPPGARIPLYAAAARTQFDRHIVAAAQGFIFDQSLDEQPELESGQYGVSFSRTLNPGQPFHFALVGSTLTSAHHEDPLNEARRLTMFAIVEGTERLIAEHEAAWNELWKSRIIVEDDPATQRDINSMLYHLYSNVREGTNYSIAPMGLSRGATGYLGHIFWDAEIWTFPALLALRPELARSLLEYRFERLAAAKRNALAHGYRGAKFPWESAGSGDEDIWSSATGSLQIHISADVAIAAWNYYRVTKDKEWLRERGFPLIRETADFWLSRVERNGPGRYDIKRVVAADEYAENVDNDAYTNGAAKLNLAAASAAAKELGLAANPDWELVRANIPILRSPDGTTREHATFDGQVAKQADVNLLAYPLKLITDPEQIRRDLAYYSKHIDDVTGPAMTKSVFAILYQRLGEPDKAIQWFQAGYHPNRRPPFETIAECATCQNPYFVTGAAGLLQTMLYGFGGLEITDEGFVHTPGKLPKAWRALTLTNIGPEKRTYVVH